MDTRELVGHTFPVWFDSSKHLTQLPQSRMKIHAAVLDAAWEQITPETPLPIETATTLSQIVKDFKIPFRGWVSYQSQALLPQVLLGIEGVYQDEIVYMFFLDQGQIVYPLLSFKVPQEVVDTEVNL